MGDRNRTSFDDFETAPPSGRTLPLQMLEQTPSGGRTGLAQYEHLGGRTAEPVNIGRYRPVSSGDMRETLAIQAAQSERQETRPLGQINQICLGPVQKPRIMDFSRFGPMLSVNELGNYVVEPGVSSLPAVPMVVRGRTIMRAPSIASFASGTIGGRNGQALLVIQPVMEILLRSLDGDSRLAWLHARQDAQGKWPVLLYDPKSGRMGLWGGGGFQP